MGNEEHSLRVKTVKLSSIYPFLCQGILICVGAEVMPQHAQYSTNDLEALLGRTGIQSSLESQRSMSLTLEVASNNNKIQEEAGMVDMQFSVFYI